MKISIVRWPTEARCYRCGEEEVHAVCHHCGRPLCRSHPKERYDSQGRLRSHEHVGLGLDRTPCSDAPIHCDDCDHVVRPPRFGLLVAGAVAVVAGRFLQQEVPHAGLALVVVGLAGVAAGAALAAGRWRRQRRERPWLPWVPRLRRLAVEEMLGGSLRLESDGEYRCELARAEGTVTFEATLGDVERHVFERYARKFRLREPRDLPFRAGFLLLSGRASISFAPGAPVSAGCSHGLVLDGTTGEAAARRAIERGSQGEWRREWRYRIEPPLDGELELPLRIVPYVLADSGGRRLRLDLEWGRRDRRARPRADDGSPEQGDRPPELKAALIEALEVWIPEDWGEIDTAGERVIQEVETSPGGELRRRVAWRKVLVRPEEARACRRSFEVQFQAPVALSARLEGRLTMELKGGVSGISEVRWFYASGESAGATEPAVTRVKASFELALGSLRHRELRVVPDPKRDGERELAQPLRFQGVVPDHATIVALGRALTERGCYLKSVVEDRPRTGSSAHAVSRLWDLAGRVNEKIHPVDFHVTLSGEEVREATGAPRWGTTSVTLAVQGTYSDPQVEQRVRSHWDELREAIERALRARTTAPGAARLEVRGEPAVAPPPVPPRRPAAVAAEPPAAGRPDDLTRLREALLADRITEATYQTLRRELELQAPANVVPIDRRAEGER